MYLSSNANTNLTKGSNHNLRMISLSRFQTLQGDSEKMISVTMRYDVLTCKDKYVKIQHSEFKTNIKIIAILIIIVFVQWLSFAFKNVTILVYLEKCSVYQSPHVFMLFINSTHDGNK